MRSTSILLSIGSLCIFPYIISAPASTSSSTNSVLLTIEGSPTPLKIVPIAQRKQSGPTNGVTVSAVSSTSSNMRHHGGNLILEVPKLYVILYGSFTQHGQNAIKKFLTNLSNSPRMRILREFTYRVDNVLKAPTGSYSLQLPFYYFDTSTRGVTLVEADIRKIIEDAITLNPVLPNTAKLPLDSKGLYLVITASNVEVAGFCTIFCGFHTFGTISNIPNIPFMFTGDATRCPGSCAPQLSSSPNFNVGLDATFDVITHEIAETITDPYFDGYFRDSDGREVADLCAYNYASTYKLSPLNALYNVAMGGAQYLLQLFWSNAARRCVTTAQVA